MSKTAPDCPINEAVHPDEFLNSSCFQQQTTPAASSSKYSLPGKQMDCQRGEVEFLGYNCSDSTTDILWSYYHNVFSFQTSLDRLPRH